MIMDSIISGNSGVILILITLPGLVRFVLPITLHLGSVLHALLFIHLLGPKPTSPLANAQIKTKIKPYLKSRGGESHGHVSPSDNRTYALVTGAGDGIGRAFASALAHAGCCSVIMLSRTESKLDQSAAQIREQLTAAATRTHGGSTQQGELIVIPFDLSTTDPVAWENLGKTLAPLPIRILINNAALGNEMPTPFVEEDVLEMSKMIQVNTTAIIQLTRLVLPGMVAAKRGLILNVGSIAGAIPSPLISVYSGTKAFLSTWSQALAAEVAPVGVAVEYLNTYYVVSSMSKIRHASFLVPSPEQYVCAVLRSVGQGSAYRTPYPPHALVSWLVMSWLPMSWLIRQTHTLLSDIRARAMRRKAKSAAAGSTGEAGATLKTRRKAD